MQSVLWSPASVCLCVGASVCMRPHAHTTARTGCNLAEW